MWQIKTILNPRDFSDPSAAAHQIACEIARKHQARIVFLHVTDKPVMSYVEKTSDLPTLEVQKRLSETLRSPLGFEAGLNVEQRMVEGDTVQQILRVAEETQCELIVMGTQGRSGLSRWFTTSVTEQVVFRAPCSVLVVRARNAEAPYDDVAQERSSESAST
jgi:nucleotide-binding universal stress UspA family protein